MFSRVQSEDSNMTKEAEICAIGWEVLEIYAKARENHDASIEASIEAPPTGILNPYLINYKECCRVLINCEKLFYYFRIKLSIPTGSK